MRKRCLLSMLVLLACVSVNAQNADVSQIHFIDSDGNKIFAIKQNQDGSVSVTDHAGQPIEQNVQHDDGIDQNTFVEKHQSFERTQTIIGPQYKKVIYFKDGQLEITVTEIKTNVQLYRLVGSDKEVRVYSANGNLIAEGIPEKMKVYDQMSFEEFKQIIEDKDD